MWKKQLPTSLTKHTITLEIPLLNGSKKFQLEELENSSIYSLTHEDYYDLFESIRIYLAEHQQDQADITQTEPNNDEIFSSLANKFVLTQTKLEELSLWTTLKQEEGILEGIHTFEAKIIDEEKKYRDLTKLSYEKLTTILSDLENSYNQLEKAISHVTSEQLELENTFKETNIMGAVGQTWKGQLEELNDKIRAAKNSINCLEKNRNLLEEDMMKKEANLKNLREDTVYDTSDPLNESVMFGVNENDEIDEAKQELKGLRQGWHSTQRILIETQTNLVAQKEEQELFMEKMERLKEETDSKLINSREKYRDCCEAQANFDEIKKVLTRQQKCVLTLVKRKKKEVLFYDSFRDPMLRSDGANAKLPKTKLPSTVRYSIELYRSLRKSDYQKMSMMKFMGSEEDDAGSDNGGGLGSQDSNSYKFEFGANVVGMSCFDLKTIQLKKYGFLVDKNLFDQISLTYFYDESKDSTRLCGNDIMPFKDFNWTFGSWIQCEFESEMVEVVSDNSIRDEQ